MEAVILAAGQGSRLGPNTFPKCMVEIGGRPILRHQLDALSEVGVERVTIVVGHGERHVREAAQGRAGFVVNERYAETNSLYSFLLARGAVDGDTFVLNGDVLFPADLLRLLDQTRGSAIACDSSSGHDDEHMKVTIRDGRFVEMRKDTPQARRCGENLGILRLTRDAAHAAFAAAETLVELGRTRDWVGAAVNRIAWRHRIDCVDVAGMPWVEIDFPADLDHARQTVWPAICALSGSLAGEAA